MCSATAAQAHVPSCSHLVLPWVAPEVPENTTRAKPLAGGNIYRSWEGSAKAQGLQHIPRGAMAKMICHVPGAPILFSIKE